MENHPDLDTTKSRFIPNIELVYRKDTEQYIVSMCYYNSTKDIDHWCAPIVECEVEPTIQQVLDAVNKGIDKLTREVAHKEVSE